MTQESPQESAAADPAIDPSQMSPTLVNLLQTDPLSWTEPDLIFLIKYYRMKRLEFDSLAKKPRTVRASRGQGLSKEATKAKLDELLGSLVGSPKDQGSLDEIEYEDEEGSETND